MDFPVSPFKTFSMVQRLAAKEEGWSYQWVR